MKKLWSNVKLNIISIIIFILAIILAYNIYVYMNTKINGIEMFYFETTKQTYNKLNQEYNDTLKDGVNVDRATFELLKEDYDEILTGIDPTTNSVVAESECLKKKYITSDGEGDGVEGSQDDDGGPGRGDISGDLMVSNFVQ